MLKAVLLREVMIRVSPNETQNLDKFVTEVCYPVE